MIIVIIIFLICLHPLFFIAINGRGLFVPDFDRVQKKYENMSFSLSPGRFTSWNRPFGKCVYYFLLLLPFLLVLAFIIYAIVGYFFK